ncbi:MAG: formylglycine-generating enzyme family protein [Polyangiaceae bacterium]|nr:formylglycine-generating enzyme family protein [Polyangiaceae bacterium]
MSAPAGSTPNADPPDIPSNQQTERPQQPPVPSPDLTGSVPPFQLRPRPDFSSGEDIADEDPNMDLPIHPMAPLPLWQLDTLEFTDPDEAASKETIDGLLVNKPVAQEEPLPFKPASFAYKSGPPLRPWSRLWPQLRQTLGATLPGREVNLPALLEQVCRGAVVRSFPKVKRDVWAPRVAIWVDDSKRLFPVWNDQIDVCTRVSDACGYDAVHVTVVRAARGQICELTAGHPSHAVQVEEQVPLLVLSDLGMFGTASDRAAWLETGRTLQHLGVQVLALVPVPHRSWDVDLAKVWNAVRWEPGGTSTPSAHPVVSLLRLIAPAALVEPGLLRALRKLLPTHQVDVGAEIELAQHPDVAAADGSGVVLRSEASIRWRRAFADANEEALPQEVKQKVSDLIGSYHSDLGGGLVEVETLAWAATQVNELAPPGDVNQANQVAQWMASQIQAREGERSSLAAQVRTFANTFVAALPSEAEHQVPVVRSIRTALTRSWEPHWWGIRQVGRRWLVFRLPNVDYPVESTSSGGQPKPIHKHRGTAWVVDETRPGSPVAWFMAALPQVTMSTPDNPRGEVYALREGLVLPLPSSTYETCTLHTDLSTLTLTAWKRESWAKAAGRDQYGLWAEAGVKGVKVKFRWIPPGKSVLGSPEGEEGRFDDEGPVTSVTWTRGWWMMETPVTQALWQAVMGNNRSRFRSPNRPVEKVSWDDCKEFTEQLNDLVPGLNVRLPTEVEWETACRAGISTATWKGDLKILGANNAPLLDDIAWYGGNCGVAFDLKDGHPTTESWWKEKQHEFSHGSTREVKLKQPNPWGLYDMLGNVWEWCLDESDWPLKTHPGGNVKNPAPNSAGAIRVLRGGSWYNLARYVRAAYRLALVPAYEYDYVGFRLVRGPIPGVAERRRS